MSDGFTATLTLPASSEQVTLHVQDGRPLITTGYLFYFERGELHGFHGLGHTRHFITETQLAQVVETEDEDIFIRTDED